MRILHLITRLIIGGAQENTILSCEGLHARGHEVYLLSGPTAGPEGSLVERARGGPYRFEEIPDLVRQVNPWHDLRAMLALQRRFVELRPDVVHTHSSKAGILGRVAAHRARVPCIVHTIHGMSFNRTQPRAVRIVYAAAERYCARRCHALVSVADAMTAQALAAGIGRREQYETIRSGMVVEDFDPAEPCGTAALGCESGTSVSAVSPITAKMPVPQGREKTRAAWGVREGEVVVGTVARLFPNKGYEQLLDVMDIAARQEPRLRFVWIGDGAARRQYEAELSRRRLRERTVLTGLLPPAEMPRVLAAIDILAHTSRWEGLPRAVVQALLMEKPAVSFAIDGTPEIVRPGETGELAELDDIACFAGALVALARDSARRAAYGRAGRARCLEEFDHRVMVERLDSLYRRLLHP